ncbi:hypothetical protein KJ657_03865 [Patescibacteria group bacterium]|nr:hypothetical protein [Patescibacteria group bacterium]MBU1016201.1 hypothetical protein [Patescibacteria group bacterium]MBU1684682.1 hypothetical protein [Patescibacteria group bacterium]MBU1938933.1 hypothetical protein [Patescibacteria group bacterium]
MNTSKRNPYFDDFTAPWKVEKRRLYQEQSVSMSDARMKGQALYPKELQPLDVVDEVAAEACKAPLKASQVVLYDAMRKKMEIAMHYYDADITGNNPFLSGNPSDIEDAMIARIDGDVELEEGPEATQVEIADPYSEMLEADVKELPNAVREPKIPFKGPNRNNLRNAA